MLSLIVHLTRVPVSVTHDEALYVFRPFIAAQILLCLRAKSGRGLCGQSVYVCLRVSATQ